MEKSKREKKRYIRELIIMAIILSIVGLTVSYAAVNATLDIAGFSSFRVANWGVMFDSASVVSKTGTSEILRHPVIKGSIVYYEVKLNEPGDSVKIKAVVKNRGNIDAKLESYDIIGVPSQYKDNVSYKVTDENGNSLAVGRVLKGSKLKDEGDRYMPVYITITYDQTIFDDENEYKVFNLGLGLNFVQAS